MGAIREREPEPLDIYPRYGMRLSRKRGLRRRLARIVPRHAYLPFKGELRLAWLRLRRRRRARRRFRGASDLLVNLAPGDQSHDGWVNVDVAQSPGVNVLFDCRKELPFPDGSCRMVFTEHFFEHLDYTEEVPHFVSECFRVLAPKGVLRVVVPDAELYMRGYCREDWSELERIRPLHDGRVDPHVRSRYHAKMELVNMVFRQGSQHKWAYDFENLAYVLQRYGFERVIRQSYGISLDPDVCIDRPIHEAESLYVEAIKD